MDELWNRVEHWATYPSSWKIEVKQMQFPEPHHKCKNLQQVFCNSKGENVQRRETDIRPMDLMRML